MKAKANSLFRLAACGLIAAAVFVTAPALNAKAETSQATVTFTPGELKFIAVPALNFGSQQIANSDQTMALSANGDVIVADLRGGTGQWKVTAQLSKFADGSSAESLPNARIEVGTPTVTGPLDAACADAVSATAFTLTSGGSSLEVMQHGAGGTHGQWTSCWLTSETNLVVPAGSATVGTHTATLTWALQDAT